MKRDTLLIGSSFLILAVALVLYQTHPSETKASDLPRLSVQESKISATAGTPGNGQSRPSVSSSASSTPSASIEKLNRLADKGAVNSVCHAVDQVFANNESEAALPVLQKLCASERDPVVQYTLAAGDGSPMRIRLSLYLAALNHPSEVIQSTARLEIENLTGEAFQHADEVRRWLEIHDQELRREEAEARADQQLLEQSE